MASLLAVLVARWRLALEVLGLVGLLACYEVGKVKGGRSAHAADAAHEAAALAAANDRYRQGELANERQVAEIRRDYAAKDAAAKEGDRRATADLRAGVVRMRVPIVGRCPDSAAARPSAGGIDVPETAQLAPTFAADLWTIAADGDAAIRQLTALQEWADSAVKLCSPSIEKRAGKLALADF